MLTLHLTEKRIAAPFSPRYSVKCGERTYASAFGA